MANPVFSRRWLAQAGLSGTGSVVTVPNGHTYVVKQLTVYANPLLAQTTVFFEDGATGAALFAAFFTPTNAGWQGFYGALVFEAGDSFHFQVDNTAGESADVFAGGYDLTA